MDNKVECSTFLLMKWKFSRFFPSLNFILKFASRAATKQMIERFKVLSKSFGAVETFHLFSEDLC